MPSGAVETRDRAFDTAIFDVLAILDVRHDVVDQLADMQSTQKLDVRLNWMLNFLKTYKVEILLKSFLRLED